LELRVLALYRQSVPVKCIVKADRAVKSYSLQDPEGVLKTLDSSVLSRNTRCAGDLLYLRL